MFVEHGIFLQKKITLSIGQNKNTSTTRTNGGSIPISRVLTPYYEKSRSDFKQALSTLERLQQEAGEEPYVLTYSYKQTMAVGIEFIHLLHGGIGKVPGGLLKIQKVKEEVSKVLRMNGETRY